MILDVLFHMALEAIGGAIAWYAYGFCHHWTHRIMLWFSLALLFSYLTVTLIG